MIIAIVRFGLNPPMSLADAARSFEKSAPGYQQVTGLHAKRFLLAEDGSTAGGVYQWESRAAAEAFYDQAWSDRIAAKYASAPVVEYFESPVAVTRDEVVVEPVDSALSWVAEHTRRYVETGGEDGYEWRGFPTLVLTTTGRRSGLPRRNALIFGRDGDDVVLVASFGGRPNHPLWYENLVADPNVTVQIRDQVHEGVASTVDAADRARLWPMMAAIYPPYDEYQTSATASSGRQIPLVRVALR